MTPNDHHKLQKLTNLIYNHQKWEGGVGSWEAAQALAIKIFKELGI